MKLSKEQIDAECDAAVEKLVKEHMPSLSVQDLLKMAVLEGYELGIIKIRDMMQAEVNKV